MTDEEKQALLKQLQDMHNPYEPLMNGTFRDTGRTASAPGEYLDSVVGAPVRTAIDQGQKGNFDWDGLKKVMGSFGSDPKNAPTGVDLAQNMGIENPYLGAAVATGLDVGAQLPVGLLGDAAKAVKMVPGVVGAVEDVSKIKEPGQFSSLKKMVGAESPSAQELLNKIDTPEQAAALTGEERQQYLSALDEVNGPRDQRAKAMGFGNKTYYHGTPNNISEFNNEKLGQNTLGVSRKLGHHFSNNPEVASEYSMTDPETFAEGGNVLPVRLKTKGAVAYEPEMSSLQPEDVERAADWIKSKNTPVLFPGANDTLFKPQSSTIAIVPQANQIRSVNAAFDPRFKDSSNLLAGKLGGGDLEDAAKVSRFSKLKDLLNGVDTPEKAAALSGADRQNYLNALDEVHGSRDQRAADMGFSPETYYHGSFADIEKMKAAGKDNFLGKSVYATSNPLDASHNYAEMSGPDFEVKYHKMMSDLREKNPDMSHVDAHVAVINKLTGGRDSGAVYPLKIRSENPINLNKLGNDGWVNVRDAANKLRKESGKNELSYRSERPGEALRQALEEKGHDAAFVKPDEQWRGFPYVEPKDRHVMLQNPNQVRSTNAAFDPRFKDSSNLLAGQLGPSNLNGANLVAPAANTLSPDLQKIAQIESSGGKNKNHETTQVGLNAGQTAGGSTGLMPIMVKEILKKNPDLAKKYPELLSANPDDVTSAINSNPGMEAELANAHWERLHKMFGEDTPRMAYAWRNGITAAKKASDIQVQEHPYVQKFVNGPPDKIASGRFDRLKGMLGN